MEKYNYLKTLKEDIKSYLNENFSKEELRNKLADKETFEEDLNEKLWVEDSVTGNSSGSYTFNTWQAEENLCHNWELLREAQEEFDCTEKGFDKGAEYWDVTIRCYLLPQAINEVIEEITKEL